LSKGAEIISEWLRHGFGVEALKTRDLTLLMSVLRKGFNFLGFNIRQWKEWGTLSTQAGFQDNHHTQKKQKIHYREWLVSSTTTKERHKRR